MFRIILATLLFAPFSSQAALLYLDPAEKTYGLGDTFVASVRVDNEGECINAAHVEIVYPVGTLRAVDFSRGGSIVTLWVEEPTIDTDKGTVKFSGGIPGGYCGRIQGDPSLSNTLGKVVFTVINTDQDSAKAEVSANSQVYLNDGLGTKVALKTQSASYTIVDEPTLSENEWLLQVGEDSTPPDAFTVEVQSTRGVFGGRYYIVFSTVDKQSGMDHFEIFERGVWKTIKSPYQLRDRNLDDIQVRAIDKAGNERLGTYVPGSVPPQQTAGWDLLSILAIFIVLVVLGGIKLYMDRRRDVVEPTQT